MPGSLPHHVEDSQDELFGTVFVEQIAHRVHEHHPWFLPPQRCFQHVFVERELETISVVGLAHCLKTEGHSLGVAVLAAGTDLGAAGQSIPSRLGPLDSGVLRHQMAPLFWYLVKMSVTIFWATGFAEAKKR